MSWNHIHNYHVDKKGTLLLILLCVQWQVVLSEFLSAVETDLPQRVDTAVGLPNIGLGIF